ncbi:tetratricopeptide repeat protein [Azospirillum doebereinerae]|uniref:tetratricopeptide repeat protein n=1 Tax=Azospirillum doebereinerae TaxID=92933 RepID=UPI001EE55DE7|nr:tetratricopeptide repeat protein [Azospirillum doebereinerae]MCG5238564.1 tetratricopeptide repeat protein [Azospirillum doebereinerae]
MNRNQRRGGSAKGSAATAVAADAVAVGLLGQAVPLHQAGRLAEAEALYRQALAARPRQPDALHLLGMIACQTGRFAQAADLIGQAVGVNRTVPDYHANLAFALQALGRSVEAERSARTALRLRAAFPEAANTLGNSLNAQGKFAEAADAYRDALRARPDYAEAQGNLGAVLRSLGRSAEAEPLLRQALARNPHLVEARVALGLALLDLERAEEGEATLRAALHQRPDHAGALLILAGAVQRRGADAVPVYRRSLAVEPADAEAWNGQGLALQKADRIDGAAEAYARTVRLSPSMTEALTNLGNIRRLQGRSAEAAALQRQALGQRPDYAAAHANLGQALQDLGDDRGAEDSFTRALEFDPTESVARFNRAILRLRQGRLAEGWADYADRFASGRLGRPRRLPIPEWTGEDLANRRILLWAEQGLGDELMFGSVLPDVIARAGEVVVECDARLVPLFQRSFPSALVRPPTREPGDADCHAPFGSLPRLLRDHLGDFPARSGWLRPDPAKALLWRERLAALGPGLTVGIAWTSRRITTERKAAYTTLDQWMPILRLPGLRLVSLQYDGRLEEIAATEKRFGVRIHRWDDLDQTNDLESTAALVTGLDLAVTVASSAGELAGALGVPVWRIGWPGWSHLGVATRPWFPSMTCVHPPDGGTLDDAIHQIYLRFIRLSGGVL